MNFKPNFSDASPTQSILKQKKWSKGGELISPEPLLNAHILNQDNLNDSNYALADKDCPTTLTPPTSNSDHMNDTNCTLVENDGTHLIHMIGTHHSIVGENLLKSTTRPCLIISTEYPTWIFTHRALGLHCVTVFTTHLNSSWLDLLKTTHPDVKWEAFERLENCVELDHRSVILVQGSLADYARMAPPLIKALPTLYCGESITESDLFPYVIPQVHHYQCGVGRGDNGQCMDARHEFPFLLDQAHRVDTFSPVSGGSSNQISPSPMPTTR